MKALFGWIRRHTYPEVERRAYDRRSDCKVAALAPTLEQLEEDRQEQNEIRRRLRRVQRELDILRRTPS